MKVFRYWISGLLSTIDCSKTASVEEKCPEKEQIKHMIKCIVKSSEPWHKQAPAPYENKTIQSDIYFLSRMVHYDVKAYPKAPNYPQD